MPGAKESEVYPILIHHLGHYYYTQGDIPHFKANRLSLLPMLPVKDEPSLSISVPQDLGFCYRREGQIDSALYYYDRALDEAHRQNDLDWLATLNLNVGILYHNIGQDDKGEQFLDRSVNYVRQVDDAYTEMCALQVQAAVKLGLHKLDEAERSIRAAWALALESEMPDQQLRCLNTLVTLFDDRLQLDSAKAYVNIGNRLLPEVPAQSVAAVGFVASRANHEFQSSHWAEALRDYEASTMAQSGGVATRIVFERMARCCQHLGHYEQGFVYLDSALVKADTLASENLARQLADVNVKYQTLEKDIAIAHLQAQRLWIVLATALVLFLVAVVLLWLRLRRHRREAQLRISALEQERTRLGRDLHDGLCNDMLALELQMQFDDTADSRTTAQRRLHELRQHARHISHQLMPPEFSHLSLNQLLALYADAMSHAAHIDVGFDAQPDDDDHWRTLPDNTATNLYRIAQEHVGNIVKGHTAAHVAIHLADGTLLITDDGQPEPTRHAEGRGSHTIKDRVTAIGARLTTTVIDGQNRFQLEL